MPEPAPLHSDVALGPAGGRAHWLHAKDGTRIRLGLWPLDGAQGTVLVFPGRTEYIEKYGTLATDFQSAGYAMAAIDWRGQGLADRPAHRRDMGYVTDFDEYQQDVDAVLAVLSEMADAPQPWYLIGHSMGGAIALRAMHRDLPVENVVFSAPMWGIALSPAGRLMARVLRVVSGPLGLDKLFAPTTGPAVPLDFEGNRLTSDRTQFEYMEHQTDTYPELRLGGPSIRWLIEALKECAALLELPAPSMPVLTILGSEEKIVSKAGIRRRMETWPGSELMDVAGAAHEVLMEAPDYRDPIVARILEYFEKK
ncbi:MAG: alpha/beta hydrolase [Pseudomonadota bacterium]